MDWNTEKEEEDSGQDVEPARKMLEAEADRKEEGAKGRLDEMLSEKNMEFCPRCSKKAGSRIDWAGKCWWEGCGKVICRECWNVHQYRFCREHAKSVIGEPEEQAKKREFFEEENAGEEKDRDLKFDLRAMLEEHDDSRKEKLKYYTAEYANWLIKNMEKHGPIDWTPKEFLRKAVAKPDKKDDEVAIGISVKKWIGRKVRLSVIVTTFDAGEQLDINSLAASLRLLSRKHKGYKLIVLVADGAKLDAVNFANKFNEKEFSLYLVEPRKGNLYFNISDPVTSGYSAWFNQKKEPSGFRERLKKLADLVSGKLVVSEKAASKEFGFGEQDVHRILKSCRFLSHIPETDTFVFKED